MKYRKLGSIGWETSALGFGIMRLPKKKRLFLKSVDEEESIKIIRSGIDQGINYIDTAYFYHLGKSENLLGRALKDGYREKIHLVSKLPMPLVRKTEDFDKFLTEQLKRLQTEYLDIYLFHGLNRKHFEKVKKLNLMPKMLEAKEKGLIKHIGFSFHDTLPVFKEIIDYFDWDVCQIQYNYMDTAIQATTDGLEYAHKKGIGVIIMEPVKGGKLANPPKEALDVMNSAEINRSPVDWALQFLWNRPEVGVVLSGMGSQQMVDENCASADRSGIGSLNQNDSETIEKLADIYRNNIKVPCTACQYCMPCPSGVNIPENFALLNNYAMTPQDNIGGKIRARGYRRKYKNLASSVQELTTKPENGDATMCTECLVCIEKCPQEINIPEELKKVHMVLGEGKSLDEVFQ